MDYILDHRVMSFEEKVKLITLIAQIDSLPNVLVILTSMFLWGNLTGYTRIKG